MNCSHVKRAIDLASMNKEALPVEARHHIETCETCRKTLDASLFLDEGLRGLELEDAPQGMEARIAARIAKIAADKQRTKKSRRRVATLMPWLAATLGIFGFLTFALIGIADDAMQNASTAPVNTVESSLILGDIWQMLFAPQAAISNISTDFMVMGLFALFSIAAMGQMVRR
ncbi:hypothetical protein [Kordiimonas sp.]|uniref:hypothetical protein n=1 Tax=Kordiimonas sp. TaxID=1970157 RepID=UPI003A956485